jgi:hypothetical protein
MPVITLGNRAFAGPFMLPLWPAPGGAARRGGLCAVMVPGWRLLTFRALDFVAVESFATAGIRAHPRFAEWRAIAGTDWNLYVATHEMSFSTQAQRLAAERDMSREYRPEFSVPVPHPELPGLRTMLLARALRTQTER